MDTCLINIQLQSPAQLAMINIYCALFGVDSIFVVYTSCSCRCTDRANVLLRVDGIVIDIWCSYINYSILLFSSASVYRSNSSCMFVLTVCEQTCVMIGWYLCWKPIRSHVRRVPVNWHGFDLGVFVISRVLSNPPFSCFWKCNPKNMVNLWTSFVITKYEAIAIAT